MSKNKLSYPEWVQKYYHNGIGPGGCLDENNRPNDYDIPVMRSLYMGLDRFLEAQNKHNIYQTALEEIKSGKKKTHWIWFIFPQLGRYGTSPNSQYYGLSRSEAKEYIKHPILRERLEEVTEAVYNSDKTVYEIFGNDAIKVRSCMLLFASVCDIPIFEKMIRKYSWN